MRPLTLSSEWTHLSPFPCTHFSNPLIYEDSSFIVAPYHSKAHNRYQETGIYSYRVNEDEWELLIPYDSEMISEDHSAAVDAVHKVLYLYGRQSNLYRFDLSANKSMSTISDCQNVGSHPRMEFAKDSLHLIGGEENDQHLIWNDDDCDFQRVHRFCSLIHHRVVFMKRMQSLWCFGGMISMGSKFDVICNLNLSDHSWHALKDKMPFPTSGAGIVSILQEQYILIIGGNIARRRSDDIFVFDVKQRVFYQSTVKAPVAGSCFAVVPSKRKWYNMLVVGYVHSMRNSGDLEFETEMAFPQCLVDLTTDLVEDKQVHVLQHGTGHHYRISVHSILENKGAI